MAAPIINLEQYEDMDSFEPINRRSPKLADHVGGEVAVIRSTDGKGAERKAWSEQPERKASRNRRKARS